MCRLTNVQISNCQWLRLEIGHKKTPRKICKAFSNSIFYLWKSVKSAPEKIGTGAAY